MGKTVNKRKAFPVREIPGCMLGQYKVCSGVRTKCVCCGWNRDENARRREIMRRDGLTPLPDGTRGLVLRKGATGNV